VFPAIGKLRSAQVLARAGIHLGATTVKRILERRRRESPPPPPPSSSASAEETAAAVPNKPVTAKATHHVWQIDLTLVPVFGGLSVAWLPFSLPQCWPFCWWVACVIDQYSRRILATAEFGGPPTAVEIRSVLAGATRRWESTPKYLVSDQGSQFTSEHLRAWCRAQGIDQRFASVGSLRATAIVERFFLSLKMEMMNRISVALAPGAFERQLDAYLAWYHAHRPHQGLRGRTPDEVFYDRRPANEAPRYEPRTKWPRASPCARPFARPKLRGAAARLRLVSTPTPGAPHLPIVRLERAS
jgi:putative transposase